MTTEAEFSSDGRHSVSPLIGGVVVLGCGFFISIWRWRVEQPDRMNVRARADVTKVVEKRFSIEVPFFGVGAGKPMGWVLQDLGQGGYREKNNNIN